MSSVIIKKSFIIGFVLTLILIIVPVETIPQAPDAAQHEYPSVSTFGYKGYGFPFTMYWKYDYASYSDLLTEKYALERGGEVYWWAIVTNFFLYTFIASIVFYFIHKAKKYSY